MHQGGVGKSKKRAEMNRAPSACTRCRSSSTAEAISIVHAPPNDMFELPVARTLHLAQ